MWLGKFGRGVWAGPPDPPLDLGWHRGQNDATSASEAAESLGSVHELTSTVAALANQIRPGSDWADYNTEEVSPERTLLEPRQLEEGSYNLWKAY